MYDIRVFPQKKLPYKKASWCSECEKSVLPPSVDKIRWGIGGFAYEEIEKIKVICPCCKNICRGGPHGKPKPKPRVENPSPKGRPEGSKTRIKTKEEIEQGIYKERAYFEQLQRTLNANRTAIIETPDENLTEVETIMKHDPTYWRILSRKIIEQIKYDSKQDNKTTTKKFTKRGSRFMSNYYAGDKDSKLNKFDIKSFREGLFREWQQHNEQSKRIIEAKKTSHDNR